MKQRIVLLFLVIALVFSGCVPAFLEGFTASEPSSQPENTMQYEEPSSEPSEEPATEPEPTAEPEPEPPTEPEEEATVLPEYQDHWTPVLAGKTLTARTWFIYDCQAQDFMLISGDPWEKVYPASVTKLFAAYVALHYILPDQVLTAGSELELIPVDASIAGLEEGDSLTVLQLVEGMLLPSGNDATYVLATAVGRILAEDPTLEPQAAVDRFVEQMNFHARALSLIGTHFVTPDGWHHDDHYSCPTDLAKIGVLALNHPVIAQCAAVAFRSTPMAEDRTLEWVNTNILLDPESDYYCPHTVGLKTGFTTPAGNCLLSAFRVGDRELIIGTFGCTTPEDRFEDTLLLFLLAYDIEIPDLPPETEPVAEPTE